MREKDTNDISAILNCLKDILGLNRKIQTQKQLLQLSHIKIFFKYNKKKYSYSLKLSDNL